MFSLLLKLKYYKKSKINKNNNRIHELFRFLTSDIPLLGSTVNAFLESSAKPITPYGSMNASVLPVLSLAPPSTPAAPGERGK